MTFMTIMTIIVPLFIALIWGIIVFKIIAGIVNLCRGKKKKGTKRRYNGGGYSHSNDFLHQMMHEDAMRAHHQAHNDAVRMNDMAHNAAMHAHDMGMNMHHHMF